MGFRGFFGRVYSHYGTRHGTSEKLNRNASHSLPRFQAGPTIPRRCRGVLKWSRFLPLSFALWGELPRRRSSSKQDVAIYELFACGLKLTPRTGRGSTGRSRTGLRVFPVGSTLIVVIARFSAAERHSRCTVTIDETRSAKHRANRAGRPLRPVRSPAIAELPYLS